MTEKSHLADPRLATFENKVANEERIEPKDWMPDAFRKTVLRQMSQHAHSEVIGRITSYNVCYTKLLRKKAPKLAPP